MKHGPSIAFRLTVYPLVAIFFVFICAFVIFSAAGYNFKFQDGRFVTQKTGMIIVSTRPGEAVVSLDGEVQSQKTPSLSIFNLKIKRVVCGTHHLVVSRNGYEAWKGDVIVSPGLVSWRDYLILIPSERKADAFNFPGSVESVISSRDHRRLAVFTADRKQNIYNIWQVNTDNKTTTKIAEGMLTAGDKIKLVEISSDYSKLLYRKTNSATQRSSYLINELQEGGAVTDLGGIFSNKAEGYYFSPYNSGELYFLQGGGLYRVNLANKTESALLVQNIVGLYPQDDQLLAVRKVEDNYGLWTINNNNEVTNIIEALPAAKAYQATHLKGSKSYLVQDQDDKDLLLYRTETKNPTLETVAHNAALYAPSANGNSIAIYSENKLRVFNISERKYYDTLSAAKLTALDWIQDDKNLLYSTNTEINIVNYNGDYNKSVFSVAAPATLISSHNNHNFFFTNILEADNDLYTFSL